MKIRKLLVFFVLAIPCCACTGSVPRPQVSSRPTPVQTHVATAPTDLPSSIPTSALPVDTALTKAEIYNHPIAFPIVFRPEPQPLEFSPQKANQSIPPNILKEITFSVSGGGGGDPCNIESKSEPWVLFSPNAIQKMEWLYATICGFPEQEWLSLSAVLPNQGALQIEPYHRIGATAFYRWLVPADAPEGRYLFTAAGLGGEVSFTVQIIAPVGPKLYFDADANVYSLNNFRPGEKVQFLYYQLDGKNFRLTGWQEYIMDQNGQRKIQVTGNENRSNGFVIVVGEQSGEGHIIDSQPLKNNVLTCPGAPPQKLLIGRGGDVYLGADDALPLLTAPGLGNEVVEVLRPDYGIHSALVLIVGGPVCKDHLSWWRIQTRSGLIGWAPETDPDNPDEYIVIDNGPYYE